MWIGFESGHVGRMDYNESSIGLSSLFYCHDMDKHSLRVNAIAVAQSGGEEGPTIWSGSESGSLAVWSQQPRDQTFFRRLIQLEAVFHYRMREASPLRTLVNAGDCHVKLELGALEWRTVGVAEAGSRLSVANSVQQVLFLSDDPREVTMRLATLVSGKTIFHDFSMTRCDSNMVLMAAWCQAVQRLISLQRSKGKELLRLGYLSLAPILALAAGRQDHMWGVLGDLRICQWRLNTAGGHVRTFAIETLRCVAMPGHRPTGRAIGSLLRVSESTLWLADGAGWITIDLEAEAPQPMALSFFPTADSQEDEDGIVVRHTPVDIKAAAVAVVSASRAEVWTILADDSVAVWAAERGAAPRRIATVVEMKKLKDEHGAPCSLVQANASQMWLGTKKGRVLAWQLDGRHFVPELQPLTKPHPGLASSPITCLSVFPFQGQDTAAPLPVWAVCQLDQSLWKFSQSA